MLNESGLDEAAGVGESESKTLGIMSPEPYSSVKGIILVSIDAELSSICDDVISKPVLSPSIAVSVSDVPEANFTVMGDVVEVLSAAN